LAVTSRYVVGFLPWLYFVWLEFTTLFYLFALQAGVIKFLTAVLEFLQPVPNDASFLDPIQIPTPIFDLPLNVPVDADVDRMDMGAEAALVLLPTDYLMKAGHSERWTENKALAAKVKSAEFTAEWRAAPNIKAKRRLAYSIRPNRCVFYDENKVLQECTNEKKIKKDIFIFATNKLDRKQWQRRVD